MAQKRIRIHDPALSDASRRRADYARMLTRRLDEFRRGTTRVDRALALMEAEVAAKLIESVTYEIALRFAQHGVSRDADRELTAALAPYRQALAESALSDGEIIRA